MVGSEGAPDATSPQPLLTTAAKRNRVSLQLADSGMSRGQTRTARLAFPMWRLLACGFTNADVESLRDISDEKSGKSSDI
jgi:hypothetical protein